MGRVFDMLIMIAIPTIFVGIPAILFELSERIELLRDFADSIGRKL